MRTVCGCFVASILTALAGSFAGVAAAAPVANLPLTCPSAAAIGQPQNNCSNLTYQTPAAQLIVSKGPASATTWARASSLASSDTLAVCTLPVEPGTYSSCRDAAGVRRIAFVAKSTVFPDSPPSGGTSGGPRSIAVVAASGGRYTDPLAAVANVDQGDAWCRRATDDPARFPCVISIAPGLYELASTLVVPAHVAVVGHGPNQTVLTARPGVPVTVQLGATGFDLDVRVALRDLAVENRFGAGGTSVALGTVGRASVEVHNVRATATGASENIGVRHEAISGTFKQLEAMATGGSTSIGFRNRTRPRIEECSITATGGSNRNVGVESDGQLIMAARCEVTAREGVTALAMSVVGAAGFGPGSAGSEVTDSKLIAEQATTENMGYYSRGTPGAIWKRVEVHVSGASSSTGIWLSQVPPFWEGYFEHVTVNVVGGGPNVGLYTEGGHHDPMRMFVVDSAFRVFGSSETSYGLRFGPFAFESVRLHLHRSHVIGQSAALYSDAPFQEWEGLGPPLVILMTDTLLQGDIELNRHYLGCTAIISAGMLYADTCPPGDWTPSPR